MGSASPERPRSREAMADVPQESSRGNCCDGLLHSPDAHVRYSFFVIGHDRRKILHFNVTQNPNAVWVAQGPQTPSTALFRSIAVHLLIFQPRAMRDLRSGIE